MTTHRNLKILFLCTLLTFNACAKKKKEESKGPDNSIEVSQANTDPDRTKLTFPVGTSTCGAVFKFLNTLNQNYILKMPDDIIPALQTSTEKFAKQHLQEEFKVSLEGVDFKSIKKNDCKVFETLANKVKDNVEIQKRLKDEGEFDPLEFILNGVLFYYTKSYDAASQFKGRYVGGGMESFSRWGIKFLDRPDYHKTFTKVNDPEAFATARKPEYLYVEYSPNYLKNKLPKYTRIYKIGSKQVKELNYAEAVASIEKKSEHALEVRFWDTDKKAYGDLTPVSVELERIFEPRETSFKIFKTNPNIAYLQLPSFSNDQLEKDYLETWIEYMHSISGKTAGVILDLRNNGGGKNYQMQKILGTIFPDPNTIVAHRKENNDGKFEIAHEKTQATVSIDYGKIVVLTDYGTASAAEMFVAAIKEYNAGLIVGETTHGKGIGQHQFQISAEHISGIAAITNFYIFSPFGESWYFKGIPPHIQADEASHKDYINRFDMLSEALPKPLTEKVDLGMTVNSVEVKNKLTPEILAKLTTTRNDPGKEPAECKSGSGEVIEEQSCIVAWGLKLLEEWIALDPETPAS